MPPASVQGSTPVPDPTELTSRAVDALRAELTALFNERLEGLTRLNAERIRSLQEQLVVSERLRLEQKVDTKTAVDAALAAQKESAVQQAAAFSSETSKTERNFSEQLTGIRDTFGTAILAQTTRYDDLKERLTTIEGKALGGSEGKAALYATLSVLVMLLLAAITVIGFVASRGAGG